jgi:hypothetical protein
MTSTYTCPSVRPSTNANAARRRADASSSDEISRTQVGRSVAADAAAAAAADVDIQSRVHLSVVAGQCVQPCAVSPCNPILEAAAASDGGWHRPKSSLSSRTQRKVLHLNRSSAAAAAADALHPARSLYPFSDSCLNLSSTCSHPKPY